MSGARAREGPPAGAGRRREGTRSGPLRGERIAVIGLGVSGRAAARLALKKGGEVHVSDLRTDDEVAAAGDELRAAGAWVELGSHRLERIADASTVVVSPGIAPGTAVLQELRKHGVPWVSEVEFAFRFLDGPLIAVTGTNGKTTTSALAAHLLRNAGISTGLGGNIGAGLGPAASELALLDPAPEWFVLEVSAFQLKKIERFVPNIGIVTNLAPDHLDWYATVEEYYADKARFFMNATEDSRWVLPREGEEANRFASAAAGKRYHFGAEEEGFRGAYLRGGRLTLDIGEGRRSLLPASGLSLFGTHNVENALAASLAVRLAGVKEERIAEGLRSFEPLPHRLQPVAERGGVLWVNDSKATNIAATVSALRSLDRPVVLLLGGKDKGEDFSRLLPHLGGARAVVTYGAARLRVQRALGDAVPVLRVDGAFEDAVASAEGRAGPGEILLLSPGCSSFDMFRDYEARGDRFIDLAGRA